MVWLTFFLLEITQKIFFLSWGFHILATQKNNFYGLGGFQWGPGGLLAYLTGNTGLLLSSFSISKAPQNTPSAAPHCRSFLILNGPGHCPLWFKTVPQLNFLSPYAARPKKQNGAQAFGMVRPTFFLWEIIQKFFFLA